LAVVLGLPAGIILITGLLYRSGASSDDAETRAWAHPWLFVIYIALASALLGLLSWLFGRAHRQRDEVRSVRGGGDRRPQTATGGLALS
jgi:membrane protein YqaA with SNARE-associated domain